MQKKHNATVHLQTAIAIFLTTASAKTVQFCTSQLWHRMYTWHKAY